MFEELFARKKASYSKLIKYGFEFTDGKYSLCRDILNGMFKLRIFFDTDSLPETSLYEESGDEYVLYKTGAQGAFIGQVRSAVCDVLTEIADKCFDSSAFKKEQALRLIAHAHETYGSTPEFLWESTPDNAILRRQDSNKWYAVIMTVPKSKLGIDSEELTEIVNLHAAQEDTSKLIAKEHFYPGWHMNKKSWYSIILDGSVSDSELFKLLDDSFNLAEKYRRKN